MKELFLVSAESTRDSLVLRTEDDEQFFLVVTDDLRTALVGDQLAERQTDTTDTTADDTTDEPKTSSSVSYLAPLHLAASADDNDDADDTNADTPADDEATTTSTDSGTTDTPQLATSTPITAAYSASINHTPQPVELPRSNLRDVDPRLSAPLKMTPREIQERIRGGASTAEIAADNDVPESRIESYAHPVLLERSQKAEMAKRAHPVRDDGPAKLTLWEILATVFTARGLDLANSTWDTYRDPTGQWVVTVTWTTDIAENVAEWSYHRQGTSSATAVARNGLAAELIDPNFVQPVRNLSAITSPIPVVTDDMVTPEHQQTPTDTTTPQAEETTGKAIDNPLPAPQSRRRRKAVTPHWEDVLLGVRSNTKRPRK
ncbi:MAG: septation protein SepH [Corynebacterium sp.]|nr:septation protein SepH [Corynebacterium sp.]